MYATSGLATAPSASRATVTGATVRRPRITVRLTAGTNSPAIESLRLRLPSGMGFSHARRALARGVSIRGTGGYSCRRRLGALVIRLDKPARQVLVSVATPAIYETGRLLDQITHNKGLNLELRATVVDAYSSTTGFLVPLGIR